MKIGLVATLVSLEIGFAPPVFARQINTPDPQLRQQLEALVKKHADAINQNRNIGRCFRIGSK